MRLTFFNHTFHHCQFCYVWSRVWLITAIQPCEQCVRFNRCSYVVLFLDYSTCSIPVSSWFLVERCMKHFHQLKRKNGKQYALNTYSHSLNCAAQKVNHSIKLRATFMIYKNVTKLYKKQKNKRHRQIETKWPKDQTLSPVCPWNTTILKNRYNFKHHFN